jgi:hypothetical protein
MFFPLTVFFKINILIQFHFIAFARMCDAQASPISQSKSNIYNPKSLGHSDIFVECLLLHSRQSETRFIALKILQAKPQTQTPRVPETNLLLQAKTRKS